MRYFYIIIVILDEPSFTHESVSTDQTTEELSTESMVAGFRYRTSSERNNQDSVNFRDINVPPVSQAENSTVDTEDLIQEVLVREDLVHEVVDEYIRMNEADSELWNNGSK